MPRRKKLNFKNAGSFLDGVLVDKVRNMMVSRRKLLYPFPLDPMHVYQLMFTEEEHKAIAVLRGGCGAEMLRRGNTFYLIGLYDAAGRAQRVRITLPSEQPLPHAAELMAERLSATDVDAVVHWATSWLAQIAELHAVTAAIQRVAGVCNTYGQVKRLWPELEGFFPEYGKQAMHVASVRSPYPAGAMRFTGDYQYELQEDFTPEALAPFSDMLAECLLLPEVDAAVTEVAAVVV